jgi:hypothetical protein
MTMPGVGVDDRDHPARGHFAANAKSAIVTGLKVLAHDGRQKLCPLGNAGAKGAAVKDCQARISVFGQFVDQGFPGGRVVPITGRFAAAGVVVVAPRYSPQLGLELGADDVQQLADRGTDQRDGVHGGYRVL